MSLAPFAVPIECPKCHGPEFDVKHVAAHAEESWPPREMWNVLEHVRWTCKRCGYSYVTKAADAP